MVDSSRGQQQEGSTKKEKQPGKKIDLKKKVDNKPVEKKLQVKKDSSPRAFLSNKLSLVGVKKFLRGAWSELKKVHWPSRRELVAFTGVVLVAVTFVAVLLFAIDSILSNLLDVIIPK